ncbi:MAG TPA: polyribonucleotide nucleotidyltransferase, partial [Thermoleophilia bacterium]|nr:polyribonucleotide nucleotidyltransferase [Thermoleophilia bacterium]
MSIAVEPNATRLSVMVGETEIEFETGAVAKQAQGAVLVKWGATVVLATAVGRTEGREGADFFPLTVDVEERMYAAGKIPGGFFKREGRAGEKAILAARMVDRPIRPLWPKGYKNEVQVIVTTFSADQVHGHDILAINGASAALMLSPMPFLGPVGAVRIGRIDGRLVVNPTLPDLKESTLDLIVCGTPEAITMVEAGADEIAEDLLIEALELAHGEIKRICELQIELAAKAGMPKWVDGAVTEALRTSRFGDL